MCRNLLKEESGHYLSGKLDPSLARWPSDLGHAYRLWEYGADTEEALPFCPPRLSLRAPRECTLSFETVLSTGIREMDSVLLSVILCYLLPQ